MTKSDIRAVDHVGITVPDLDAAQRFFENVFGAEFLYDMLDGPLCGPEIEEALGVPAGTTLNAIRMLRLGQGPSLELFSYSSSDQKAPVVPSDFGLQHFALFVDDIEAVAARIELHGGKILGQILALPGGDSGPGNRFVYFRTPWGMTMELVDVPSPQAYEKSTALRRWKPERGVRR
jgi:catechol 2,3-dioxygenase-like lactoylglutathione lyase family enzyme